MKNSYIRLLLIVTCLLSMTAPILAKNSVQTHKTKLHSPFSTLTIPSEWKLEDIDKNEIEFLHADDKHVSFKISAGRSLKKGASLDELESQFTIFIINKSDTVPMIEKSFGWIIDEDEVEEVRQNIDPNFERVFMGKIEWLKIIGKGEIRYETRTETTDGQLIEESVEVIHTRSVVYATFIKNRLHLVECSAPEDYYDDYSDVFLATMQSISS